MKNHKTWGGATAIGESQVRVLRDMDMPFAQKFVGDTEAYKKNGFYETHVTKEDDGFLILGQIQTVLDFDAPSYLSSSPDARMFHKRGEFAPDNVGSNNLLLYAGNGQAFVLADGSEPYSTQLYRTRNGVAFTSWFTYYYYPDPYGSYASVVGEAALYRLPTGRMDWTIGVGRMLITTLPGNPTDPDGQYQGDWVPQYLFYKEREWYQSGGVPYYANKRHGPLIFDRVGPQTLVAITRVYRKGDVGSLIEPTVNTTPRSFITVSADNGETWTAIDETDNNDFIDLLVDHTLLNQATYNGQVAFLELFTGRPVNRTQCYVVAVSSLGAEPRLIATLNLETLTLSDVHEVDEPLCTTSGHTTEPRWVTGSAFVDGFHIIGYADPYTPSLPVQLLRTPDFVTYETVPTTFAAEHTGRLSEYDEHTLLLPRYEADTGKYAVYESKDAGTTWRRRGTIRSDAAAPPTETPYNPFIMQRFNSLTMIRRDGLAANGYPSQPWVGDERRIAPEAP